MLRMDLRMYRGGTEVPPEVGGQGSRPEAEKRPFAPAEGTSDKYLMLGGGNTAAIERVWRVASYTASK